MCGRVGVGWGVSYLTQILLKVLLVVTGDERCVGAERVKE